MKRLILVLAAAAALHAQNVYRWSATTGDVSLSSAGTTATVQQPANNASDVAIDQVVVYCSVACSVTQAVNGAAATATAGTVNALAPTPPTLSAPVNFFTASNVGSGTAQGGIVHIAAGPTYILCLSKACGATGDVIIGHGTGTASNYSVTIGSMTGTVNIAFFVRTLQ